MAMVKRAESRVGEHFPAVASGFSWFRGLAVLALTAGCASELPTTFHTLLPVERPIPISSAPGPLVRLESVRVPEAVNQPQWLIRLPDGTLAQLERERWASLPADEIAQALREVLRLRFNISEGPASGGREGWRVRVEVLRFETLPNEVRLEAMWTVAGPPGSAERLRCTAYLRETSGGGMAALGDAHRRAVARLGDFLGATVVALDGGEQASCPG